MLAIHSLYASYNGKDVLKDINLQVQAGEVLALIGPNGAGKTTLIRAASGVLHPRSGKVYAGGSDLFQLPPRLRACRLAVVPQARLLPPSFTVYETVLLGRTPYLGWMGKPSQHDCKRVNWALEKTQSAQLTGRLMGELSGGEQQRVLLARALAQDTPVLLLDEPTAHLDLRHQSGLLNLIQELAHEQQLAVLMALHDLNLVALYADRVALLVEGRLKVTGAPEEVLTAAHLTESYQVPLSVTVHPEYGTPLVLPDGRSSHKDISACQ
jgi:ABC-type cobalamin/Fe3+-siderophores transport system ATPase subunit